MPHRVNVPYEGDTLIYQKTELFCSICGQRSMWQYYDPASGLDNFHRCADCGASCSTYGLETNEGHTRSMEISKYLRNHQGE